MLPFSCRSAYFTVRRPFPPSPGKVCSVHSPGDCGVGRRSPTSVLLADCRPYFCLRYGRRAGIGRRVCAALDPAAAVQQPRHSPSPLDQELGLAEAQGEQLASRNVVVADSLKVEATEPGQEDDPGRYLGPQTLGGILVHRQGARAPAALLMHGAPSCERDRGRHAAARAQGPWLTQPPWDLLQGFRGW